MNSLPGDLTTLVQTALALDGADRRRAAGRINDWLRIRHQAATEVERDEVLMWMDHPGFSELSDQDARNCRAEAAELLLSLGYPSALYVSPEALVVARRERVMPTIARSPGGEWIGRVVLPFAFVPMLWMAITIGQRHNGCIGGYSFSCVALAGTLGLIRWVCTFPSRGIVFWHLVGIAAFAASIVAGVGAVQWKETEAAALCWFGAAGLMAMGLPPLLSLATRPAR
ncbi:MAG: hypothetical protein QM723_36640 [Myxococcaceae bacterium]